MLSVRTQDRALFATLVAYSVVPIIGGLVRVVELSGGPAIIPENPRATDMPIPDIVHILSSVLFCVLGALQLLPSLRQRQPSVHRHLGRIAVLAGIISAGTGLWMTHFYTFPVELQGAALYYARVVLSILMLVLIIRGVVTIRSGKVKLHRASMVRAYAIGLGASTQAVFGIIWFAVIGNELLGPARDSMMISAWVLNLLVAELILFLISLRVSLKKQDQISANSQYPGRA